MSLFAAGSCSSPSLYPFSGFLQQTAGANDGFHRHDTLLLLCLLLLNTSLFSSDLVSSPNGVLFFQLSHFHAPIRAVWKVTFPLNLPFDQIVAVTFVSSRADKTATSAFFHVILVSVAPILCALQLNIHLKNTLIITGFEGINIIFVKFKGVYI